MSEAEKRQSSIVATNLEHFWKALWTVLLLVLGLGITALIDSRIPNHPEIIEMKRRQSAEIHEIKKQQAAESVKMENVTKALIKLEVHMENTEKTMASIWREISETR